MELTKTSVSNDAISKTQQFNFWIGNWNIQQKILQQNGSWLELSAKTSVSPTLDGLALIEHWEGETLLFWEGMEQVQPRKGLSVRAYDPKAAKWNIYWMDTRNRFFRATYSGNFIDGKGEFFGEEQTPEGKVMGRITFSNIMSSSVHWDFALSNREEGAIAKKYNGLSVVCPDRGHYGLVYEPGWELVASLVCSWIEETVPATR